MGRCVCERASVCVCVREEKARTEGLQRGAAECFTVMDVPHGDPVCDATAARRGGLVGRLGRLSDL